MAGKQGQCSRDGCDEPADGGGDLCAWCWEGYCDGMADAAQGDFRDYDSERGPRGAPDYWQDDGGEWRCG